MERLNRVILKLSGELFGENGNHIDFQKYDDVANRLIEIKQKSGTQLAIVVGGGNIFRGRQADIEVDHTEADFMGMLATVINGVGLREALVRNGEADTRLMTAFNLPEMAEPYIKHKARHHLQNGRMVIIAGGLGIPNFSTDSAIAQYADELMCQMVLKASTVDGVYDSDPRKNPDAKRFAEISYQEALQKRLAVMDATAFAMCMRSDIPIFVFNIKDLDRVPDAIEGDLSFGTVVKG
ncbi:MAG TPA: UMP kinase [Patescibacteria group bacterium]